MTEGGQQVCSRCGGDLRDTEPQLVLCRTKAVDRQGVEAPGSLRYTIWPVSLCGNCVVDSGRDYLSDRSATLLQYMLWAPLIAWLGVLFLWAFPHADVNESLPFPAREFLELFLGVMLIAAFVAVPAGLIAGPVSVYRYFRQRRKERNSDDYRRTQRNAAFMKEARRIMKLLTQRPDDAGLHGDFPLPEAPTDHRRVGTVVTAVEGVDAMKAAVATWPRDEARAVKLEIVKLGERNG